MKWWEIQETTDRKIIALEMSDEDKSDMPFTYVRPTGNTKEFKTIQEREAFLERNNYQAVNKKLEQKESLRRSMNSNCYR